MLDWKQICQCILAPSFQNLVDANKQLSCSSKVVTAVTWLKTVLSGGVICFTVSSACFPLWHQIISSIQLWTMIKKSLFTADLFKNKPPIKKDTLQGNLLFLKALILMLMLISSMKRWQKTDVNKERKIPLFKGNTGRRIILISWEL